MMSISTLSFLANCNRVVSPGLNPEPLDSNPELEASSSMMSMYVRSEPGWETSLTNLTARNLTTSGMYIAPSIGTFDITGTHGHSCSVRLTFHAALVVFPPPNGPTYMERRPAIYCVAFLLLYQCALVFCAFFAPLSVKRGWVIAEFSANGPPPIAASFAKFPYSSLALPL